MTTTQKDVVLDALKYACAHLITSDKTIKQSELHELERLSENELSPIFGDTELSPADFCSGVVDLANELVGLSAEGRENAERILAEKIRVAKQAADNIGMDLLMAAVSALAGSDDEISEEEAITILFIQEIVNEAIVA